MKGRLIAPKTDPKAGSVTVNYAKLTRKFSVDFGVAEKDVTFEKIRGEKYCVIVQRGVNKTCEGSIQYLEANFSISSGERIVVRREKLPNNVVRYFIPNTDAIKYPIYSDTDDSVAVRKNYILLNDCFSQLLSKHLAPADYEFKGVMLIIKKKKEEVAFLRPFFNSDIFGSCIEAFDNCVVIHFDADERKKALVQYPPLLLKGLFEALSPIDKKVEWTEFPITQYVEKFNNLLPKNEREVTHMHAKDAGLHEVTGPVIRIPTTYVTAQILRTHLYILDKFEFIERKDAIYMTPEVARKLFLTVGMDPYEYLFRVFLAEQKHVMQKLIETGLLGFFFTKKNLIVLYKETPESTVGEFMAAFLAASLMPSSIDATIGMCTRFVNLKLMLDKFKKYFTVEVANGKLVITSPRNLQCDKLVAVGAVESSASNGSRIYTLDMCVLQNPQDKNVELLQAELTSIADRESLQDGLENELIGCVKNKKIRVRFVGEDAVLDMASQDSASYARPLLNAIGASKQGDTCEFKTSIAAIKLFMEGKSEEIFTEVKLRHQMVKLFAVVKGLYGNVFVNAVKQELKCEGDVVFDEVFFKLGVERLQLIYKSIELEIARQKQAAEDKKDAELRAALSAQKSQDEEVRVRLSVQKKGANAVVKPGTESTNAKLVKRMQKNSANAKQQTNHTHETKKLVAVSKSSGFSRQQNMIQPQERGADPGEVASYYDYDSRKHAALVKETPKQSPLPCRFFDRGEISDIVSSIKKDIAEIIRLTAKFVDQFEAICKLVDVAKVDYEALMEIDIHRHLCILLCNVPDYIRSLGEKYQQIKQQQMEREFDGPVLAFLQVCEARMEDETLKNLHELVQLALNLTSTTLTLTK